MALSDNARIKLSNAAVDLSVGKELQDKISDLSGTNAFTGTNTFSGTANFTGTFQIGSTTVSSTAAEIDRNSDTSARKVAAGGTLTLTEAAHEGKIIALDTAAGSVVTLPTSTGGGGVYRFLVTVTATSNSHVIKVGNATDEMRGFVIQDSDTATAPNIWWAADNDDTITLNRTDTGLAAQGEYFEIVDFTSGHFFVRGYSQASGTEATPFSASVS